MEAQAQRLRAFPSHPNSPPATPGSQSQPRFPSAASHTTPTKKRMGFAMFAHQSPPLEHIEPTGQDHQFHYTRPQAQDLSSRPSSASGFAQASSVELSSVDLDASDREIRRPSRAVIVVEGNFVVEEVADNASGYGSNVEVLQPDTTDEAGSDRGSDGRADSITEDLQNMNCGDDDDDDDEREEDPQVIRYRRKKKRWSAGYYKRSHSQSVGSDSDVDDVEALDAHDVGSSARRLRRRVRGPGDRSSLNFEEIPSFNIPELDEPDEDGTFLNRPPSLPSDEENLFNALPFWSEPMLIDSDASSRPSSRGQE